MLLPIAHIACFLLVSDAFFHSANAAQNGGLSSEERSKKVGWLIRTLMYQNKSDYSRFKKLLDAKKYLMRCYLKKDSVLADIKYKEISTFASFKPNHDMVAQFMNECQRKYFDMVTRALKEWGMIGDAIEIWMRVANDHFIKNGRSLEEIFEVENPRSYQDLGEKFEQTFETLNSQEALNYYNMSISLEERDNVQRNKIKLEYLSRAYYYGEGICNQLTEESPFHEIFAHIDRLQYGNDRNSEFTDTNTNDRYEMLIKKFTIDFWKPLPKMDLFHPMALLHSVRYICKRFRRLMWTLEDQVPANDQWTLKEIKKLVGKLSDKLWKIRFDALSWQDRCQMKRVVKKIYIIRAESISNMNLWTELEGTVIFASNQFHKIALKIIEAARIDWKETVGHAKFAYDISDWLLNDHYSNDYRTIEKRISVRNPIGSKKFELIFFNGRATDKFKRLDAWLNGTGYCDIYMTQDIQDNLAVFEIMQTLKDFASLENFLFENTNRITQLFYMRKICQQARIIPFDDPEDIDLHFLPQTN